MVDETQDAILEAAFRAFVDFGFEKATTKRIAEYAGVNEVTIFRKFGNKAALMQEVVRREVEGFQAHIHYTGDVEADLVELITSYRAMVQRRGRFLPTLFSEILRRPELRVLAQKPLETVLMIVGLIGRYQAEGKLRPEPPHAAAISLMAPVLVQTLVILFAPPGLIPDVDPRQHVASYLDGRRAERRTP